ncbi:MAG: peptidyl-prolyl cis-trans isomerase [Deltaproteobacteria bacterium]|nr:peptidyl-prolyl cis-trans isomerase [Deltaproteobacteria bacterium]
MRPGRLAKTCFNVLFLTAAFSLAPAPARPEVVDRVVAVVNDGIITLSELNAATAVVTGGLKGGRPLEGKNTVETKSRVLDNLIERMLIKQSAERMGIEVSEREIDNAIEDVEKQNNITHETLLVALAKNGLTFVQYREQIKEDIRQVKFLNQQFRSRIQIPDEDVEGYYRQNIAKFSGPPSYRLRVIFLSADKADDPASTRLGAVSEGLKSGAGFEALAREYSDEPSARDGGDIGYVKSGELSPVLEDIAKLLSPGQISEPVAMPDGVYIIQLVDRKPGEGAPLDKVKNEIRNTLYKKTFDERYNFWLMEMKKIAYIEVRL